MEVDSVIALQRLEALIKRIIEPYRLEQVLFGLRKAPTDFERFVIGGSALFAVRFCTAGRRSPKVAVLGGEGWIRWLHLVRTYLLADPIGYDKEIQREYKTSNPIFTFLRIAGSQMPFNVSPFGQHAQPLLLYHEIPKQMAVRPRLPSFNYEECFQSLYGASTLHYINVGFTAFAAATSTDGFTRGYFTKARDEGIKIPSDRKLLPLLDRLAADPVQLRNLHRKHHTSDPRFAIYDFNPLLMHPLVRPWRQKKHVATEDDRMVAPIPDLVVFKNSVGIFYEMFNRYGVDFSNYFGFVFEAYIGRILQHCVVSSRLLSEDDLRQSYSSDKGKKVPDWIVVEGETAILIECKATRFSRAVLATGDEAAVNDSLKQVIKGLRQLDNFRQACLAKRPGLEVLHGCKMFRPLLLTLEPLYLINSRFFRKYLDDELAAFGVADLPWYILSVDELERLQPYMATGVGFDEMLKELRQKSLPAFLDELHEQTGLTFKDSFLYEIDRELYRRLGVPD
jgi:hypothetical protein